jgi:hypothetical protein
MQLMLVAFPLALARAGKSSPARMAIIAITTSNSINVKPLAMLVLTKDLFFLIDGPDRPVLRTRKIIQLLAVVNRQQQSARRKAKRNGG